MAHPLLPMSLAAPAPARLAPLHTTVIRTCTTVAVRPAAELPLPLVYTAMGATRETYFRNCDLAVEGSPSSSTLMSPRRLVPSGSCCGVRDAGEEEGEEVVMLARAQAAGRRTGRCAGTERAGGYEHTSA